MPRTTQEILDHADELAKRFEDYDPQPEDRENISPLTLLRLAAYKRAQVEREITAAVCAAKTTGVSWASVGEALGTSGEAARQKYSQA